MKKNELFTKYSNVINGVREVVRDVMIIIGMAVIVVFPFVFVLFIMYVQTIIFGNV